MAGQDRVIAGFLAFGLAVGILGIAALPAVVLAQGANTAPQAEAEKFTPPPRSIADITAILDQEKPNPGKVAEQKAIADAVPPAGLGAIDLEQFYTKRGIAADVLGRGQQAAADLHKALDLAADIHGKDPSNPNGQLYYAQALSDLARVLRRGGHVQEAIKLQQEELTVIPFNKKGMVFGPLEALAADSARAGNFDEAANWLRQIDQKKAESMMWRGSGNFQQSFAALTDRAHGDVAQFEGKYSEAETYYRRAAAEARQAEKDSAGESFPPRGTYLTLADYLDTQLASVLTREGRPTEAEFEARQALLSQLNFHGRYSVDTVAMVTALGNVLSEQGRFKEAEKLARTALDTDQSLGIEQSSVQINQARVVLASALVAQRRWAEALAQFDAIRKGLADNPAALRLAIGQTLDLAVADLRGGRPDEALRVTRSSFEMRTRTLGEKHYNTVEAEGLLAASLAVTGNQPEAQQHFTHAVPILLGAERHADDEDDTTPGLRDQRLQFIIESYLGVLAGEKTAAGAAEAFRIADAIRGRAVQRALAATAARATVKDPALAAIIRKEQDDQREVQALGLLLASEMALPSDQRDDQALAKMRGDIDKLRAARADIRRDIAKRFPDYLTLIDPKPATVEQVQAALRPGEALLAVYSGEDRGYVWAVPKDGPAVFAVANLSRADIDKSVKELRKALDPDASTLADIPAFRTDLAYKLYAGLLAPVKSGWQNAKSLLVVPHGALGQLPFALLVTAETRPPAAAAGAVPFADYKNVPWLVRQVAVTQLPSVTALTTLRAVAPAPEARKPFIGFGDPWFNAKEAAAAEREGNLRMAAADTGVTTRGIHVSLRSAPRTEVDNSAGLGELPRLPDTAQEVREVAIALKADPVHDVFTGLQANEQVVRTTKLDDRRVVMFATHGLVPGDLDGLNEPALALTAPSVAHVGGDGLLTVSKILGLHLDADWVVLSACNTAAGNGAGAEAVSGLGLAFFYAGSRALLVSNWPVETTAARVLTTELFRRQAADPQETRAEALRQSELALIDGPGFKDPATGKTVFSYAHPLFWAPFSLVGDGGAAKRS